MLRSLKIDEMLPVERAIQSRMKECFDFKPIAEQWKQLMEACLSHFVVTDFIDPVTGVESCVIYPRDEYWTSYDEKIKEGDSLNMKASADWKAFIEFFDEYFEGGDESKALAGGRYGCAQS